MSTSSPSRLTVIRCGTLPSPLPSRLVVPGAYAHQMGIERLEGVREKLVRADEHLHAIRTAEAEYIVTEAYGVRRQFEEHIPEKSGRPGLTWRADLVPVPPLRLAVLCGDFVHSLRSSLDHLSRALVLENGGTPVDEPPSVTQFPIYEDRLTKAGSVRDVTIQGGISAQAQFLLDSVQPYQRVDDPTLHLLWLLHRLWNIDKHRTLAIVGVNLGKVTISFQDRIGRARAEPFTDGHLIFWVLEEHPDYDPDEDPTIEYSPTLALEDVVGGDGKDLVPLLDLLGRLRDYVRYDVVSSFARLCFGEDLPLPEPAF
jgi:hypothetical protein